jgi:Dolichyl-phosphate-mannose-protein mannosyltransferase
MPTRRNDRIATVGIATFAAALYLTFLGYGCQLEDEGTILYQILRTYRGERPYLDFNTGYTPAIFYLNAGLFRLFGVSVVPVRLALAIANTFAVVLVYRLARHLAPIAESLCAALVYAVFMPFFAGQFAAFNIPYPAWYAVAAWLAAQLASVRAAETGRRSWLAAAGMAAGVAFSFKPNTGVLGLGAVILSQLLVTPPAAGVTGTILETLLLVVAAGGVAATLNFEAVNLHFPLLAAPTIVLIGGAVWLRGTARARGLVRPLASALADAGAILAGFAGVTALWLVYYLPKLGFANFLRDVLLIGAGIERIYLLFYPAITPWSEAVLVLAAVIGLLPFAISRRLIAIRSVIVLLTVAVAGVIGALFAVAYAPEGLAISIVLQLENVSFYLFPLLLAAAVLAWIARGRSVPLPDAEGVRVTTVTIVYALLLFIQLHPRIDFMHIVISMPSALILAAGALACVERRWVAALAATGTAPAGAFRRVRLAALAPVATVLVLRGLPLLDARLDASRVRLRRMTVLDRPAMPVALERDRDHDLRELRAVTRFVRHETRRDEPIIAFPALAIIPFLTDRGTPVPDDYYFSGRPDHASEAGMLAAMEATRTPLVVTLNDRLGYFSHAPPYYFMLRNYVRKNYSLVRRFGRFDVFLRHERATAVGVRVRGGKLSTAFARGDYRRVVRRAAMIARHGTLGDVRGLGDQLADVDRSVRQASVAAITAVASREPGGLAAVAPVVAPGRRSLLLFVRSLGEFADQSALGYLARLYPGAPERIRQQTSTSINFILARTVAARFSFGTPDRQPLWRFPPDMPVDLLVGLLADEDSRYAMAPLTALVAAKAGRRDLVPTLEDLLRDRKVRRDNWITMMTTSALVSLGRPRHVLALFDVVNRGTMGGQYVPSLMLDPGVVPPAATALCLRLRLGDGSDDERETTAWMSPYVGARFDEELRAASADPVLAVRRAASWAVAARAGGRRDHVAEASGG